MKQTPLQNLQDEIGVTPDNVFGQVTLKKATAHFRLTKEQGAHFFAQIAHETGNFKLFEENLNYSAKGLIKTFPKYFKNDLLAKSYERKPEKIANKVYANRMGNGNEASLDGWKYRGRGFIQLTGRNGYANFAEYVQNFDIVNNPDLVVEQYALASALYYFHNNNIWDKCKKVDNTSILAVTKAINGGTNGLQDRIEKTYKFYNWLK
jgi:putative chitinase